MQCNFVRINTKLCLYDRQSPILGPDLWVGVSLNFTRIMIQHQIFLPDYWPDIVFFCPLMSQTLISARIMGRDIFARITGLTIFCPDYGIHLILSAEHAGPLFREYPLPPLHKLVFFGIASHCTKGLC